MHTTIIIRKNNSRDLKKLLQKKLKKRTRKGNLSAHFGQLKRGLDGLLYQKKIREDED